MNLIAANDFPDRQIIAPMPQNDAGRNVCGAGNAGIAMLGVGQRNANTISTTRHKTDNTRSPAYRIP